MSSTRPETQRSPSSSATARSPVKYQPSRMAFVVGVRPVPVAGERLRALHRHDHLALLARRDDSSGRAPGSGSTSRTREKTPARPAHPGLAAPSGPIGERVDLGASRSG